MHNMWRDSGIKLNPSVLLGEICKRAPRFKGWQQQDSHELLRYLLDGADMEERKRIKMEAAASQSKDQLAPSESHTFVQGIFGGQLRSTVACSVCGHISIVYESFLDLSIPITEPEKDNGKREKNVNQLSNRQRRKKQVNSFEVLEEIKKEPTEKETKKEEELLPSIPFIDERPPFPNRKSATLESCLYTFTDPEVLDGEEMFGCEECTKRDLIKKGISLDLLKKKDEESDSSSDEEQKRGQIEQKNEESNIQDRSKTKKDEEEILTQEENNSEKPQETT